MLKLYTCVVCEKVILAQDSTPSLINLFNKIILAAPPGAEIPANAVAPKEWAVYASWDLEPGDELKQYSFCMVILFPDQTQFGGIIRTKIATAPNKRAKIAASVLGFPIGQKGFYTIRTWVEENQQMVSKPIEFKIELETKQP